MKRISAVALISLFFSASALAQTTDSLNTELFGQWKLESVKFKAPVDLNKDGVKSADAIDEYTECEKDQEIQLLEDMTAKRSTGIHAKDCKAVEEAYTWKVVKRTIRDSHYDNGKRIINDHVVLVLILKGPKKGKPGTADRKNIQKAAHFQDRAQRRHRLHLRSRTRIQKDKKIKAASQPCPSNYYPNSSRDTASQKRPYPHSSPFPRLINGPSNCTIPWYDRGRTYSPGK